MQESGAHRWLVAFALIYFTFFLDNVLLTVLVPIIPDWIRGESLAQWTAHAAPLATLLNSTVQRAPGVGASQAVVGAVLSAKALAQLAAAGPAAAAVCRVGPARVLRAGTALLLLAALVLTACSGRSGIGVVMGAGVGRAAHGAGAAAAGVAGLALAAATVPLQHRHRALATLLGAVALGVLVGYPFGGATYALWSRTAPFLIIVGALIFNIVLQYIYLDGEEFNKASPVTETGSGVWTALDQVEGGRRGCSGACAGGVLLSTCVMAALEPCLPLWINERFHPARWVAGAVFVPDSAAYLVATTLAGGVARALGAERVALAGQVAVGVAAIWLPLAGSVRALAAPHVLLGAGLGTLDAALVPALVGRAGVAAPHTAALLQAAGAAAYALGPALGGALAWLAGFDTTMRVLGVVNLLYAGVLYYALVQDPLSPQWGATSIDDEDSEEPAPPSQYHTFH